MDLEEAKSIAEYALRQAGLAGASYAEARAHATFGRQFALKNGEPQPSYFGESFGLGLRVISGGALSFAATNSLDRETVKDLVRKSVKLAKASARILKKPIVFDRSKPVRRRVVAEEKKKIENADPEWLRGLLNEVESRIAGARAGVDIPGRTLNAATNVEEKYYVNTDGARITSRVPRLAFYGFLTAVESGEVAQRSLQVGEAGGLEVAERTGLVERVEKEAVTLGKVIRNAQKPPTETVDVILSPELSGIAAHESVGHPQEADRILGREGAQAGESYLKPESLGTRVGSEEANISDDPTLTHSFGFSPVDDEGVEGRKRFLIKGGVINEFLHNRHTANEFGTLSNGSSRSVSFDREPIIRMSNTFVEPGDYTLDEMIREVKLGVYFKSFTEWNIDDKRLNQRYVALEAYLIEQGEMKGLVKAPVLEITTPRLWSSVAARTRTLEFEAATCGKGDPMQGAPVWTGGPDTLLRSIKLGAR